MKIKLLDGGKLPEYRTSGAACADCYCCIPEGEVTVGPFESKLIGLGFALEIPKGYEVVIEPRSSFAYKQHGLVVHGEIDNDYRGELKANVINLNSESLTIKNGDRICQIKMLPVYSMDFQIADELSETERGSCGFGSTGK